ncbi:MAG: sugar ABC transporter ATP-binding protein [Planctomycetaceae bacterium]|nr:sugar ABC transporter ATP-binding protein [Planctomycetaceae bacterium]
MGDAYLLEVTGVSKSFPGVQALKDVHLQLKPGEVHALLGENGAGKSTLIKIIGGIHRPDTGEIRINGQQVVMDSVSTAKVNGVSIIHQEIVLVPHLSIAENIFLGSEIRSGLGLRNKAEMDRRATQMATELGLDLDVRTPVSELTLAQRQMVEIIKAVSFDARVIIMDEPTSSLTEREVDHLFKTITSLRTKGVGIVYISHRLSELFTICDRVTVMRDGTYVGTKVIKGTNLDELIAMMVGREMKEYYTRSIREPGETVLEVRNLCRKGVFTNVNFSIKKGEIVGFSGLAGSGRSEIFQSIFGVDPISSGEIFLNGKAAVITGPQDAINKGISLVPEDRKKQGLVLSHSVEFNLTLTVLREFTRSVFVNKQKKNSIVQEYSQRLRIKTSGLGQRAMDLSGGNQQKVVIAKWLAPNRSLLILDEPTRGVDVGAKAEIYEIMDALASHGMAIVMISSELPEIINMSDRVVVVHNGEIAKELPREQADQETIMYYATGGE